MRACAVLTSSCSGGSGRQRDAPRPGTRASRAAAACTGRTANCAAASAGSSRQRPAAEGDLGELLARAEAVEDLAAREARARAARAWMPQRKSSRRFGHGVPAGLSIAKSADARERRRHAAERRTAQSARRWPVARQVGMPGAARSGDAARPCRPCCGRPASASACGAWSSGSVSPTSGSTWPSSTSRVSCSCTRPKSAGVVLAVQAPVQADDAVVLDQQVVGRRLGDAAAGEPDDDEPALEGDALARLVEDVAADRVVDDVGAVPAGDLLDDRDEVLGRVVDDVVGAELRGRPRPCARRRRWRSPSRPRPCRAGSPPSRRPPAPAWTSSQSPALMFARRCSPT